MKYSASSRGFYADQAPSDAVPVSKQRYDELMAAQAAGAEIVPGPQGAPIEKWPPVLSEEERQAAELERWRNTVWITDVQLLIGLVAENWITEAEGAAWRDGELPPQVSALIASLPADQQYPATVRAKRGRRIDRLDPLVAAMAAAQGKTATDVDGFFRTYSEI